MADWFQASEGESPSRSPGSCSAGLEFEELIPGVLCLIDKRDRMRALWVTVARRRPRGQQEVATGHPPPCTGGCGIRQLWADVPPAFSRGVPGAAFRGLRLLPAFSDPCPPASPAGVDVCFLYFLRTGVAGSLQVHLPAAPKGWLWANAGTACLQSARCRGEPAFPGATCLLSPIFCSDREGGPLGRPLANFLEIIFQGIAGT